MRNGRERDSHLHEAIHPGTVLLVVALMLPLLSQSDGDAPATTGVANDLSWHTIDAGGETYSTGGSFELNGTVGQPDVGVMAGAAYTLTGGFWFGCVFGDGDCDSDIDLGDFEALHRCLAGPGGGLREPHCATFDSDYSGDVGLEDVAEFQVAFSG